MGILHQSLQELQQGHQRQRQGPPHQHHWPWSQIRGRRPRRQTQQLRKRQLRIKRIQYGKRHGSPQHGCLIVNARAINIHLARLHGSAGPPRILLNTLEPHRKTARDTLILPFLPTTTSTTFTNIDSFFPIERFCLSRYVPGESGYLSATA